MPRPSIYTTVLDNFCRTPSTHVESKLFFFGGGGGTVELSYSRHLSMSMKMLLAQTRGQTEAMILF
jgi:hypothetical protein